MCAKDYNYLIKIEYDGSEFVGWQYQINGESIQNKIEKALLKIFNHKIRIIEQVGLIKVYTLSANMRILKLKKSKWKKFLNSINFFLKMI